MRMLAAPPILVAVLCLSLSACQSGDDAPGPSHPIEASPSVDPSEAAIAERAAEAERRYSEYRDITDRHRIDGTRASEELFPYLGAPETWDFVEADDDFFAAENLTQVGKSRVVSIEMTGYDGDPLADGIRGHRVKFGVCLDHSEIDIVREDGTSAIAKDQSDRVLMNVVMQGQEDGRWTVNTLDTTDDEC